MQLQKAERKKSKLRIWLSAPSWAWKTYSALKLSHWLCEDWKKIAIIDTENGSWELYSDLWDYNSINLQAPYSPERFIEAIEVCENSWMEIIIIDSISHEWEWNWGCLELNDKLAQAKFKWNTWAAWSSTTARHQNFIEKITTSSCHIITTVRNKIDTVQEWWKIKKVWIKEQTREWFEYELTVNFNIDRDWHLAVASKDRTNLFIDLDPFLISEETGKKIIDWNNSWKVVKTKDENFNEFKIKIEKCKDLECLVNLWDKLKINLLDNNKFISKEHLKELWEIINNLKKWFIEKK